MAKCNIKYSLKTPKVLMCKNCRHSNQNDDDRYDGFVFCKFGVKTDNECGATTQYKDEHYFMFEEFDGQNCTFTEKELELIFPEEK